MGSGSHACGCTRRPNTSSARRRCSVERGLRERARRLTQVLLLQGSCCAPAGRSPLTAHRGRGSDSGHPANQPQTPALALTPGREEREGGAARCRTLRPALLAVLRPATLAPAAKSPTDQAGKEEGGDDQEATRRSRSLSRPTLGAPRRPTAFSWRRTPRNAQSANCIGGKLRCSTRGAVTAPNEARPREQNQTAESMSRQTN